MLFCVFLFFNCNQLGWWNFIIKALMDVINKKYCQSRKRFGNLFAKFIKLIYYYYYKLYLNFKINDLYI